MNAWNFNKFDPSFWSKRKKTIIICGVILGIILILFLWNYYFAQKGNWQIYINNQDGFCVATDIVYYGPDINSKDEYYSGKDRTNGTICIYTLHSRFDEHRGPDRQLYIVGNISKIYNTYSKTYLERYDNEINKFHYGNWLDYDY